MLLKDVANRAWGDSMPYFPQRTFDAALAPTRILRSKAHDQVADLLQETWTPNTAWPVRPLVCDELTMPAEDCVSRGDRGHLHQNPSANKLALCREPAR